MTAFAVEEMRTLGGHSKGTEISLRDDLSRPSAYPGRTESVEVEETHVSWVFLVGDYVYKVKKPVDYDFLDFRTLEARESACHAEVVLNRRLAPDVYLGVVPVCRDAEGRASIAGTGGVIDCAVHMRRLPAAQRADRLLASGKLTLDMVDNVAARLAAFHRTARCDANTSAFGSAEQILENIEENFAQIDATREGYLTATQADDLRRWQTSFVRRHAGELAARVSGGHVRDGHGDLRLEQMYIVDNEPTILDCIEFNERFRFGDVASDLAFLTMDLARSGRVDLAERLLAQYARRTNDFELYGVIDFYESYRAVVRGKVNAWLAGSMTDGALALRASRQARRSFLFALSPQRPTLLLPALVVVGGEIACGKSTVAEALAELLNAPCVDADRTRKAMVGRGLTAHVDEAAWEGAYDPSRTDRVYAEVLRRAEIVLASGRPVVLDASFRSRSMRRAARELADRQNVPFRFVECRADLDLCRARLAERATRSDVVSDGRQDIVDDVRASFQAVDELPEEEHIVLDTSVPLTISLEALRTRLATWPPRFVG